MIYEVGNQQFEGTEQQEKAEHNRTLFVTVILTVLRLILWLPRKIITNIVIGFSIFTGAAETHTRPRGEQRY